LTFQEKFSKYFFENYPLAATGRLALNGWIAFLIAFDLFRVADEHEHPCCSAHAPVKSSGKLLYFWDRSFVLSFTFTDRLSFNERIDNPFEGPRFRSRYKAIRRERGKALAPFSRLSTSKGGAVRFGN